MIEERLDEFEGKYVGIKNEKQTYRVKSIQIENRYVSKLKRKFALSINAY